MVKKLFLVYRISRSSNTEVLQIIFGGDYACVFGTNFLANTTYY